MKKYRILDNIQSTKDLKKLSYDELNKLCSSLREFIVDNVSKTGGHLSSNLGIVEIAVALEREFNSKIDRLIYDVGHQCYVHKILTGRKQEFENLRQYGGISGFLRPKESKTDACISGHASNSVSVALGMAHARTVMAQNYNVVAIIGDGALTGGMAYEALNSAGDSKEPLIVVLNDNNMSIDKNVGALSRHLANLRLNPQYLNAKNQVKRFFDNVPLGKPVSRSISKVNSAVKSVLLHSSLFEEMGFAYLGPIDGHDIKSVCETLSIAKQMKKPVLIHAVTQKGRGYLPAEQRPDAFHGVSAFDAKTGLLPKSNTQSFSSVFFFFLCEFAKQDTKLCAVTAAMPSGTGLSTFASKYPKRFFDVGIAEEHAVSMTAGMAKQGLNTVCAIYSTFLQRGYDQLIHDVAIDGNIHAVFALDRAGIVGADGATHNGVFDIAFLRSIPNMKIFCPSNFAEMKSMLYNAIYKEKCAVALRYPRGTEGQFKKDTANEPFSLIYTDNKKADITFISYGIMINEILDAVQILKTQNIRAEIVKINEISEQTVQMLKEQIPNFAKNIAVVEDVVQNGSFSECVARIAKGKNIICFNTGNKFMPHGNVKQVYEYCGINSEKIAEKTKYTLKKMGR